MSCGLRGVTGRLRFGGSLEILHPSLRQALERNHEILDALLSLGGQGLGRAEPGSQELVLSSKPLEFGVRAAQWAGCQGRLSVRPPPRKPPIPMAADIQRWAEEPSRLVD